MTTGHCDSCDLDVGLIDGQCSVCGQLIVVEGEPSGLELARPRRLPREMDMILAMLQRCGVRYIYDRGSPDEPAQIAIQDIAAIGYTVDIVYRFDPITGQLLEAPEVREG